MTVTKSAGYPKTNVYVFAHHHKMTILLSQFLSDCGPKFLLCEASVEPYYRTILGDLAEGVTFKWTRTHKFMWLILRNRFTVCTRRRVDLVVGSLMGMQVLYACALFRVDHIYHVINHGEHEIRRVPPRTFKQALLQSLYTVLLGHKVVSYRWDHVEEFGIAESSSCDYWPMNGPLKDFPTVSHDFDLVILDFDLTGFPVDIEASISRLKTFIGRFRNPALKPHPTHPGLLLGRLEIPIIDKSIPAEALSAPGVTFLSLLSSANSGFRCCIDVRDHLAFDSEEERQLWTSSGGIFREGGSWHLRMTEKTASEELPGTEGSH